MLRNVLILILVILVARAVSRTLGGVVAGTRRPTGPAAGAQTQSVHMARDPVCGTYVIPERAVAYADGPRQLFFCSATCRDRYRARPAEGRTA